MSITIQTLISIFATITYGGLLVIVLISKPLKKLHRIFLIYLSAMLLWSVSSVIIFTEWGDALIWLRILVDMGIIAAAGMFFFVQDLFALRRWWSQLIFWYLLLAGVIILRTDWVVISAFVESGDIVYEFHPLFMVIVGPGYGLTIFSLAELLRGYRSASSDLQRIRLRYLIIAVSLILLVTFVNFTDLGRFPIDIAVNGIAAIIIAYAILRHSLLDLQIVIRAGLVLTVITAITGLIYYLIIVVIQALFEDFMGDHIIAISIVVAFFTSVIFSSVRERIQYWVDRFLYQKKYRAILMIQRLSEITAALMNLEDIAAIIHQEIIKTLKIEKPSLYIQNETKGTYNLVSNKASIDSGYVFSTDNPVIAWFNTGNRILTKGQLDVNPIFRSLWSRDRQWIEDQEIEIFVSLIARGELVGFFTIGGKLSGKPYTRDEHGILVTLANQTANAVKNAALYNELHRTYVQTVVTLANAIEIRDTYTSDHSQYIASLGVETAKILGCNPEEVQRVYWGSLLHDIGKIGIPDRILLKPGPLNEDEWQMIKKHPDIGADLIKPIRQLADIAPIIRYSHERYDGTGYPEGLKGSEIPLEARIVAVVDAFSAMMDKRVYKDANTLEGTIEELKKFSGKQFDPQVLSAFMQLLETRPEYRQSPFRQSSSKASRRLKK
jgi:HD-GYP domain-containing protein (c-di-GMP phosphodiesterase class II)